MLFCNVNNPFLLRALAGLFFLCLLIFLRLSALKPREKQKIDEQAKNTPAKACSRNEP